MILLKTLALTVLVALIGGCATGSEEDVEELRERVAVLEAQLEVGTGGGNGTESEEYASQADLDALSSRVGAIEMSTTELETRLQASELALDDLNVRGGVWSEEGSGSGTCARVDVVTDSDRPLVVMALVEASLNETLFPCIQGFNSTGCSSLGRNNNGLDSWSSSTTVQVLTSNVGGADFSALASRTETHSLSIDAELHNAGYTYIDLNEQRSWSVPVSQMLTIPSAGSYTIEIQVTGSATIGMCRLVVMQP